MGKLGESATARLLKQPFMVDDISDDDGPLFVAVPLRYLRFDRDSGTCTDAPIHAAPSRVRK